MLDFWLAALGLMLVLEGLMPFIFPKPWRQTLRNLSQLQDGQVRFLGLTLMLSGLLLIYWIN
ncbi:MAG: hypothetical protein A3J87_03700 [Sideroxydans sp. RIFOXYB12_FULL_59_6]|jgi:hypothetical protein|nr:MAG: hypothetical protein A3J87_03700 [Sideroxydans sp. RIFOXYB12_FULL_59_6]OHC90914.1 MAG: hypothetical protein A3J99_01665 [Sideroxydans sp. RIFOXYD2_FULL_59_7]